MEQMTAVSLFAGVGGFDLALQRNGVKVVVAAEIDKHARSVLSRHFPETMLYDDVRKVDADGLRANGFVPERGIITGGFPCQDLSVAGKRLGFGGERSSLFYEIARIADETKARWLVLENVPGLLSSQRGADMGAVIGTLVELGYCVGWRVLDARYFGVPQRRRRVFIVAERAGDPTRCAQVLFEPTSLRGDFAASGTQGQETARGVGQGVEVTGFNAYSGLDQQVQVEIAPTLRVGDKGGASVFDPADDAVGPLTTGSPASVRGTETIESGHVIVEPIYGLEPGAAQRTNNDRYWEDIAPTLRANAGDNQVAAGPITLYEPHHSDGRSTVDFANTLNARMGTGGNNTPVLIDELTAFSVREDANAGIFSATQLEVTNALQAHQPSTQSHHAQTFIVEEPVSFTTSNYSEVAGWEKPHYPSLLASPPSDTSGLQYGIRHGNTVRRLTPLECERLQGFPDGWTEFGLDPTKPQSDSHRYKQMGNAVAVPVVEWLIANLIRLENPEK